MISQERLKIDIKLLFNTKSYMRRRLAQQRMTLSDLKWPFHASRAISAVAGLLVMISYRIMEYCYGKKLFNFGVDTTQDMAKWQPFVSLMMHDIGSDEWCCIYCISWFMLLDIKLI